MRCAITWWIFVLLILSSLEPSSAKISRKSSVMKKPMVGLVSQGLTSPLYGDPPPNNAMLELFTHPNVYIGAVINGRWFDIEPQKGVYNFSSIEQGLNAIQQYNSQYCPPVRAKLRIGAGNGTPQWVIDQVGGPVILTSCSHIGACSVRVVSYFWTPQYQALWRNFTTTLALQYDDDPLVQEVGVTSCSSSTAEPFIIPNSQEDFTNLTLANFTLQAYEQCISDAFDDYSAWVNTPLDFPFSPLITGPFGSTNVNFTIQVMQSYRMAKGSLLDISNS